MIRAFLFVFFSLYFSFSALCEVIGMNQGWKFQRLQKDTHLQEIKNQGTDWSSQFNVEHVEGIAELQVPEDTLRKEFALLQRGIWETVSLPHTPVDEDLTVVHQWQGVCYYQRTFDVPEKFAGQQVWLSFEGAMHLADVWINGKHIAQHAGGYTPFVLNVGQYIKPEGNNVLLVRLDNRDNGLIPPGKPLYSLDFCYYGGLYRDVDLIIKPEFYITDPILANETAGGGVFITYPEVSRERAVVRIKTQLGNAGTTEMQGELRQTLYEMEGLFGKNKRGKKVASLEKQVVLGGGRQEHVVQEITLQNPRLWDVDAPYLYLLQTELVAGGKVVDRQESRMGVRKLEMTRERGFVLNGRPLRLVGSNRHMEYPYVGNALSDNAQYRDIFQIKTSGFNIVRLGHYPQAIAVLDACDELGVLAIEPIPGWQFFNKNPLFTELTYRDVRTLIRRDRNHPSIVMWETILNESWPPAQWKDGAIRAAHEEYPGDQCFTSGDLYGYDGYDVSYNDWQEGFQRPNTSKNPGFIREYYDYEFGGHYSTTRIRRGDGEKALLQNAWNAQWSHNRYRAYYPWTMGDAVWSMYDYNRGCADNICYSGVADVFRLPKYSLAFYKSQIPEGTPLPGGKMPYYLFIANQWTPRSPEDNKVVVFGNVDEVELRVNGKIVKKQKADRGKDSDYVKEADGGNCAQLVYPPFTFTGVTWEAGTLQAIGFRNGKEVVKQYVSTPQQPEHLKIEYFQSGKSATRGDLLIVNVYIEDRAGTLCVDQKQPVRLTVNGGRIRGPEQYVAEAGIASFVIDCFSGKNIEIVAEAENMKSSRKIRLAK